MKYNQTFASNDLFFMNTHIIKKVEQIKTKIVYFVSMA